MSRSRLNLKLPLEPYGVDLRDAFFDELNRIASEDRNVLLLADDQGAFSLQWMRENLPDQYLNVGIAEQNLISVAAGLALGGKLPFLYGIATFMTMRCYEQIRNDLCCMNLPVTIVGSGPGYTYGGDGPTHHALQDVAIMRTLPDMTILNPSDAISSSHFARVARERPGPKYIRIEKGMWGKIYDQRHDFSAGFEVLLEGAHLMIVSTGIMVHHALRVAQELSLRGVDTGVTDMYRLKPVDGDALTAAITGTPCIVTLEEHSVIGGLGSLVTEILTDSGRQMPVKRLGVPDHFTYSYGSREWLQSMNSLDVNSLVATILDWVSGKP